MAVNSNHIISLNVHHKKEHELWPFSQKKQHEWNPPWKSADEVFSEDFGKLLIKDLKYLQHHPEKWERYAFNDADLGIAENLTSGRPYQGKNQTLLKMHTSQHQSGSHKYTMPVYVTEKQLKYAYPKAKILNKSDKAHITLTFPKNTP